MSLELFQRVSYNKTDIEKDASEEKLVAGAIVKIIIDNVEYKTEPTKGKGPGEDFVQLVTAYPLDPNNGAVRLKRFRLNIRNTMPVRHPDFLDTHVPPEWCNGLWSQFVHGFIPERHSGLVWKDGKCSYNGKEIAKDQVNITKMEISESRLKEAVELLKTEGKDLYKRVCYATIKHTLSADGSTVYTNVDRLRAELAPTEQLTPLEKLTTRVVPGSEGAVATEAAKAANGHTAKSETAIENAVAKASKKRGFFQGGAAAEG